MNDVRNVNLTLVITSMSSGGAERVMSTMANYWIEKGMTITLVTLDSTNSDFYELHPRIKRIGLDLMIESLNPLQAIKHNLNRLRKLRAAIKSSKPDVVISFLDRMNVLTLLATRGLGVKVIVSERIFPPLHNYGKLWSLLRRISYPWANAVVIQSVQSLGWVEEITGRGTAIVIPNPIMEPSDDRESEALLSNLIPQSTVTKTIVAMGRLDYQKGFDILIKTFADVARSNSDWRLVIFGEGKERNALVRLSGMLGIADRVYLPGRVTKPMSFIRQADIFVLSSRYEGFPNALMEAMACGVAVISFDCFSGPREIIRNGIDGLLVPPEDMNALAEALQHLISDEAERKRVAERAPDVITRFGLEKVMGMWETTLLKVVRG